MTHDEIRESLGAYALDALSPEERREIEAHLATCAECREEAEMLGGVPEHLGLLAVEMDPPPALRGRLMAIVEQERAEWLRAGNAVHTVAGKAPATHDQGGTPAPVRLVAPDPNATTPAAVPPAPSPRAGGGWLARLPRAAYGAGGALAVAAVLLVAILVYRNNQSTVTTVQTYACAVAKPKALGIDFSGAGCSLKVRSDRSTEVAFTGLPALPASKAYELWLLPGKGAPVPVGGFVGDSAASFTGHYPIDARGYPAAAVTVERAPGTSKTPTTSNLIILFKLKA